MSLFWLLPNLSDVWKTFGEFQTVVGPWFKVFLQVFGTLAILIVPISNAINEVKKQRRLAEKEEADKARQRNVDTMRQVPPENLSPMISAFSDMATADQLRREMTACTSAVAELTALIKILAAAQAEANATQKGASEETP